MATKKVTNKNLTATPSAKALTSAAKGIVAKSPTPTPTGTLLPGQAPGAGTAPININQYNTTSASVADISKKYGIDYSREYAKRQAEAAAQAKRTGLNNQLSQTDLGVKNANDALDKSYFQKGLAQAQSNVNGGVNAGLANETNLRLGMNRQSEMADVQREASLARTNINTQLTDVETARVAQEEQVYQERLQQAIALIQQDRSLDQNEKQMLLNAALTQRGQNIDQEQFNTNLDWDKYQFNNMSKEQQSNLDWLKYQFNNMSASDKATLDWSKFQFNNMSASDLANLDWSKYQFNNMSASEQAANKLAYEQLEEQKSQFATEQKWREYQFKNMSAAEKRQFEMDEQQFGTEMAWKREELRLTGEMALAQAEAEAGGTGSYLDFLP